MQLVRRGFFPKGGGCVKLHVKASRQQPLPPLELTSSPSWTRITLRTFTAGRVGDQVAQRMITAAKQRLSRVSCSIPPAFASNMAICSQTVPEQGELCLL